MVRHGGLKGSGPFKRYFEPIIEAPTEIYRLYTVIVDTVRRLTRNEAATL